jgi:membrane protease YdiL (CAAX protease family)
LRFPATSDLALVARNRKRSAAPPLVDQSKRATIYLDICLNINASVANHFQNLQQSSLPKIATMNIKKILLFLALTFALSYLLAFGYFAVGGPSTRPALLILSASYMFMPMLAALLVQRWIYRAALREPLRLRFRLNRWFLVAWLLPPVLALATFAVTLLMPGVAFSPDMAGLYQRFEKAFTPEQLDEMRQQIETLPVHPFWLLLLQGLVAGPTVNAVAGFGEEVGWRGLLLRELEGLGIWKSSLVIGPVWGLWHAPLILHGHNYPDHPWAGVFLMCVFTTLLSPLMAFIVFKADSVIAAAIFHGTINAFAGLPLVMIRGGDDLTTGMTGLPGFIALVAANIGLWAWLRSRPLTPAASEAAVLEPAGRDDARLQQPTP